jgi:hypothetical protein
VAQYAAEAFVASDRSLACLPERQRDDVVEALVIALVVIVLEPRGPPSSLMQQGSF